MRTFLQHQRAGMPAALLAALCVLGLPAVSAAQDPRGAVQGRVVDSSGGTLPGTTVTVTNTATGTMNTAVTNDTGSYSIPFMTPGTYDIKVELTGFKRAERKAVEVRIADRLTLDFNLEVGGLEETVTVTGGTPLLETRSASQGQVIDEKRIQLMPLSDGNPFTLTRLAAGTVYTGDLKFSRAFDNGGTSAVTSNGAAGGNEFTMDGSPNMANGRRVAFVPPAGAVQEFKVETATFDAQQGHTAGATVNVTMKSGTNTFRGDGYYHIRDEKFSKNDFFLERAGQPKAQLDYKRYGFTLGGPVDLGFYDGRNKTFFFTAVEWLYDTFPEPGQFTVPTEAQRTGDFSALLPLGIQIFDPATAQLVNGQVRRTAFPGNVIPANRLNPVAREMMKYYPAAQSGRQCPGPEQLPQHQRARRRLLLVQRPRRPPVQQRPQDLCPLLAQQPRRVPRQLDGRSERHQSDRQLPVPDQRCRDRRSRLDDEPDDRAQPARQLVQVPGTQPAAAPGHLRSGHARVLLQH